jgi:hypothetical protein
VESTILVAIEMARKILCVAEKPAIAKSVAQHLSGGAVTAVSFYSIGMMRPYEMELKLWCREQFVEIGL